MKEDDESRDEIRLSKVIVDRLQGRFEFSDYSTNREVLPVDVPATNERLVLAGRNLDRFSAVSPEDDRVMRLARVLKLQRRIHPKEIVLLLLCGGMSFRSAGQIHPLKLVHSPHGGTPTSLLARQLNRLYNSSLDQTTCYIVGTPLNIDALEVHISGMRREHRHRIYAGGLAPILSPSQLRDGPPVTISDPSGQIVYNPIGHLEALRWFVLSGALFESIRAKVVMTASYSNWGRIFSDATITLAGTVEQLAKDNHNILFVVEVMRVPAGREKGSILVASTNETTGLKLIKPNYGRGELWMPADSEVLMSTNTLYFSVTALLRRLQEALPAGGLADNRDALINLLRGAGAGTRDRLAVVFEAAFPIEAQLIPTAAAGTVPFLRAERDLDQLTLMAGPPVLEAVEVGPDRAVFLKLPSDFQDPAKLAYLFEA